MSGPTVVSLFTGAGGLDFGLEAAGFCTRVAVESDGDCWKTLQANRPDWTRLPERDALLLPAEELLDAAGLKVGEVDLLVGGPPCQPFSKAGYWIRGDTRRLDDPRAATLSAYIRLLEALRPRVFLMENVEGFAYPGKDEGLKLFTEALKYINERTRLRYRPVKKVVDAARYGVPQHRTRWFMVAAADGRKFRFPPATHVAPEEVKKGKQPYRTAWDAIGHLKPGRAEDLTVPGKWAALLPTIPEGQNYLWHTAEMAGDGLPLFGWRTRFWTFLLKLAKNRPSWTIQANPGPSTGPFHWSNRRLSVRELAALQTFPRGVVFEGERRSVHRQIGNAVPSLVGEVLGRAIRVQLLDLPPIEGRLTLLPSRRKKIPGPEPVKTVPKEFMPLVGKHQAHPGTGLGPAARARQVQASAQ